MIAQITHPKYFLILSRHNLAIKWIVDFWETTGCLFPVNKAKKLIFQPKQSQHYFSFQYLFDESQQIAKKYSAVCTPDFFGYNKKSELQYRGRILEARKLKPVHTGDTELRKAMKLIAETGKGPQEQFPSMGCSIKWYK